MKTGRIELYSSRDDNLIGSFRYNRISKRNKVIDVWKSRYRDKFNQCYLQIIPDVDEMKINENGQNKYAGRALRRQIKRNLKSSLEKPNRRTMYL